MSAAPQERASGRDIATCCHEEEAIAKAYDSMPGIEQPDFVPR